jgi:hypothetical protein
MVEDKLNFFTIQIWNVGINAFDSLTLIIEFLLISKGVYPPAKSKLLKKLLKIKGESALQLLL